MTRHLPTLSILAFAYGGLLAVVGIMLVCSSPIPLMEGEELAVIVLGCVMGLFLVALGIAHLAAGWLIRQRKARIPILVILLSGTIVSPCCGVLPLALAVYGCVVLLDDNVKAAFDEPDRPSG